MSSEELKINANINEHVQFDKCTVLKPKIHPERLVEDNLVRK
jgi:hypothetical protein